MSKADVVVQHLPYLRRYACALTGNQVSGDAYVAGVAPPVRSSTVLSV
jgi:hypothetical protein